MTIRAFGRLHCDWDEPSVLTASSWEFVARRKDSKTELNQTLPIAMKTITATELSRNLSAILDRLSSAGEGLIIERSHRPVARLVPGPGYQTALEAMADVYRTLPDEVAAGWLADSREEGVDERIDHGVGNPWGS